MTSGEPYEMALSQKSRQFEEAGQGDQPFRTDQDRSEPDRLLCLSLMLIILERGLGTRLDKTGAALR